MANMLEGFFLISGFRVVDSVHRAISKLEADNNTKLVWLLNSKKGMGNV